MIRAVFMGSDAFSLPVLEALLARGPRLEIPVQLVGVVTQPDRPTGRGRKLQPNVVKVAAAKHALLFHQPERIRDPEAIESVMSLRPDVTIVASFGQILPRALLDAPRFKSLNLHPSLLPRFRGASPIETALLEGETETGSTLMLMTPRMDSGPILRQEKTDIRADETSGELSLRLARLSADLLLGSLSAWFEGGIMPVAQDESLASYTARIKKEDGRIDWTLPAETLVRRIRAFNPWPVAFTYWEGRQVRLLRAHAEAGAGQPGCVYGLQGHWLIVGTGNGLLAVEEIQLAGGKPSRPADLAHGYPGLLSATLSSEAAAWSSA